MKIDPKILQDLKLRTQNESKNFEKKVLLSVDYGEKFCGLAFSPDGICVFPLLVIPNKALFETIIEKIEEKKIQEIIFGLPLSSDNYENKICQQVKKIAQKFKKLGYKIHFQNERFSSQNTITSKKNSRIDDLAAAKILEYFLEKTHS